MRSIIRIFALLILPLACGSAAYIHSKAAASVKKAASLRTAGLREVSHPIEDLNAVLEFEREQQWEAVSALDQYPKRKAQWLRGVIQDAVKNKSPDLHFSSIVDEAASDLGGIEGRSGVDWVSAQTEVLRLSAMDGWAKADPEAAFDYLVTNHRMNPCRPDTMIGLLDHQAKQGGPVALLAAIERTPWAAFPQDPSDAKATDPPQSQAFRFSDESPLTVWVESGALAKLAEQGVPLSGVFGRWSQIDLEEATQGWLVLPHSPWEGSGDFDSLLGGNRSDDDQTVSLERFRSLYSQASPENQGVIRQYIEGNRIGSPEQQSALRSITGQDETKPSP